MFDDIIKTKENEEVCETPIDDIVKKMPAKTPDDRQSIIDEIYGEIAK